MRGCVVLWVVAVVVAGAVASSQHQLAVAWLVLSVQVTSSDTILCGFLGSLTLDLLFAL